MAGRLLTAVVILVVLVVGALGLVGSLLNRRQEPTFSADLMGYESAAFAAAGNGFAAMSEISVCLFGSKGETQCTLAHSFPDGLLACAEGVAVCWSEGGTELGILRDDGKSSTLRYVGGVTAADVNGKGDIVVLAGEKGYKGFVNVLQSDGSEVYRVYVGSGYPLDADISPDSRRIAILSLTAEGSRVTLYSLDSEEPVAEWTDEAVFFDVEYLPDGSLYLLSPDSVVLLTDVLRERGRFAFGGDYLMACAEAGEHGVVLALGEYKTGASGRLVLLDGNGKSTAELTVGAEVVSVSTAGSYVAVRYTDELVVYDGALKRLGGLDGLAGIQAAIMRSDGGVILVSGGGAAIFGP